MDQPDSTRNMESIDAELRVLAVYRRARAAAGEPVRSTAVVDSLLEERMRAHVAGQSCPQTLRVCWITV